MRTYTEEYLKRIADELRDIKKQLVANNRNLEGINADISYVGDQVANVFGCLNPPDINRVIELKQELQLPDGATVHVPGAPDREERFYIIEKGKPREMDISWKKSRVKEDN